VELSAFYVDACKDRIYCDAENDPKRRSAQSAMYEVLDALIRWVAPVLAFTAEEAWKAVPGANGASVHLEKFSEIGVPPKWSSEEETKWEKILQARGKVNEALEEQRKSKKIGKSLEARVEIRGEGTDAMEAALLEEVCLVSGVEAVGGGGPLEVTVFPAKGTKCERCWRHSETVGNSAAHPALCHRCDSVVTAGAKS
jgi:isoleucyl-tRNA synthetase